LKQTDFAHLAAITQPMVSKYLAQGLVKTRADGSIDPKASLDALAGRLDEEKRQAALAKLAFLAQTPAPTPPTPADAPLARSAKLELDEIKLAQARLDLARAAGELVPVARVEEVAYDAVQALRQAWEQQRRPFAERLAADLGLTPERALPIARALQRLFTNVQASFVDTLALAAPSVAAHAAAQPAAPADQVAAE
jgi:hypothetical protein